MRQLGRGNRPDRNGEIPTRNEIPGSYRTLVCYCFLLSQSVFEAGRGEMVCHSEHSARPGLTTSAFHKAPELSKASLPHHVLSYGWYSAVVQRCFHLSHSRAKPFLLQPYSTCKTSLIQQVHLLTLPSFSGHPFQANLYFHLLTLSDILLYFSSHLFPVKEGNLINPLLRVCCFQNRSFAAGSQ